LWPLTLCKNNDVWSPVGCWQDYPSWAKSFYAPVSATAASGKKEIVYNFQQKPSDLKQQARYYFAWPVCVRPK